MIYNITIFDCPIGWVKHETTTDVCRVTELREQAAQKARECLKAMGKDSARDNHFVYCYFLPAEKPIGGKKEETAVYVYMLPYKCDDATFYGFIDDSKPTYVGAIHGNNVCSKFFE